MIVFTVLSGTRYEPYLPLWVEAVKRFVKPDRIVCFGTSRPGFIGVDFIDPICAASSDWERSRLLKIKGLNFFRDQSCPVLYLDLDLILRQPIMLQIREIKFERAIYLVQSVYRTVGELIAHRPSFAASNPGLEPGHKNYNSGLILLNPWYVNCEFLAWQWQNLWESHARGYDQLHLIAAINSYRLRIQELPGTWNTPVLNPRTVGWHDFHKVVLSENNSVSIVN